MIKQKAKFISAARFGILTPVYDMFCEMLGLGKKYRVVVLKNIKIDNKKSKVLDAGCGTGSLAIDFKRKFPKTELYGIDIDERVLAIAKTKINNEKAKIRLKKASITSLPFDGSNFDAVYSSLVFHHLTSETKRKAMKEVYRVLKRGGKFYLFDFGMPKSRFSLIAWFAVHLEEGYDNIKGNFPSMLHSAGFKSVKKVSEYGLGIDFLVAQK